MSANRERTPGAAVASDSSSNNTATRFMCLSFARQGEGLERRNSPKNESAQTPVRVTALVEQPSPRTAHPQATISGLLGEWLQRATAAGHGGIFGLPLG